MFYSTGAAETETERTNMAESTCSRDVIIDSTLRKVADSVTANIKITDLGRALGVRKADIDSCLATNYRTPEVPSAGTRTMLLEWSNAQTWQRSDDVMDVLCAALVKVGLGSVAQTCLPASHAPLPTRQPEVVPIWPTEPITSFADAEQPTSSSISEESRLSEGSTTDLSYCDEIPGQCVKNESLIGRGSYGEVFKATLVWRKKAYPIALKKYLYSDENEDNWREIKKGPKTNSCPHIVKILGYMETPPQLSIVMELMTYGSLSDFTKKYYKMPREIPPWPQIVEIIYDVIQGMDFLHTLQNLIIHRDLKLDNVLITNGFKSKIGDLGLATTPGVSKSDSEGPGTLLYLPPEAWSDSKSGDIKDKKDRLKKFDIYAFGVTAWTFLSGVRPYLGRDRELPAIKRNGESPDPDLEMIPPDTPPIIKHIITDSWNAMNTLRPEFSELARRCKEARDAYSDEDREVARTEMQNRCNRIDRDGTGEERIPSLESSLASLDLR